MLFVKRKMSFNKESEDIQEESLHCINVLRNLSGIQPQIKINNSKDLTSEYYITDMT